MTFKTSCCSSAVGLFHAGCGLCCGIHFEYSVIYSKNSTSSVGQGKMLYNALSKCRSPSALAKLSDLIRSSLSGLSHDKRCASRSMAPLEYRMPDDCGGSGFKFLSGVPSLVGKDAKIIYLVLGHYHSCTLPISNVLLKTFFELSP